ncbi:exopolysaccharide biosynthesis polyprenyl glycosylphosphotransferase [Mongoliitalea daihaiensis]|uniref:exopolysaccharide biosynthesis polyprenyl glycosylphosphotransferase n=1 Tax=Mongoliitalea daihaiensis TaxID=2782006 RepID=UPI001F416082|nr:exopolysaccharide biosynthesis polyprenyl glycosylphosphotransferase [Mongoliitalea daihaiensis]UJP66004.1 exopolysaccharide biosynthesis polyprenyl glycosylphosphotransferase [Mongoliitalea daihaiensis]
MEKRFDKYFPWFFIVGDVIAVILSFFLTGLLIQGWGSIAQPEVSTFSIFIMVWLVITILRKDYRFGRTSEAQSSLSKLLGSLAWFLAIVAIVWMPVYSEKLRLMYFVILASALFLLVGSYRIGIHLILRKTRAFGFNRRRAIILGKGGSSSKLEHVFNRRRDFGIQFLGYYDDESPCDLTKGTIEKFFEDAPNLQVDVIYINENLKDKLVRKIINYADEHYIKVKIIPGGSLQLEKNLSFSKYGDFFVINVNEIPLDSIVNRFFKRSFDLAFSLLVTVFILSWLIPLVGLLIKLESKGPIFFIQERNGVNNNVFRCLKFRSMTPNDYADTHQATKNDPRVTKIGSFLRNTSLDEMPQFLNVLMGDMSIVGPRPHTIPMNKIFKSQIEKYNSRHKIKPGITGLAQVKGFRGEIENPYQIRSRVKLDYFYIQNWSIWMDFGICVRTMYELVLNRENAY